MDLAEKLLLYTVPALLLALISVIVFFMKLSRESLRSQEYREDRFRHDIEIQIAKLQEQLAWSQERFASVNHLLFEAQAATKTKSGSLSKRTDFLASIGVDPEAEVDPRLVFVLTPFNLEFEPDYRAIHHGVEEVGLRCSRGDDEFRSAHILHYVLREVPRARVVIANISGRNPNVFYELGIAHAIGKQVIIVARAGEEFPFDIADTRVFVYRHPEELRERLMPWLVRTISE